jgi:hypothetical protein
VRAALLDLVVICLLAACGPQPEPSTGASPDGRADGGAPARVGSGGSGDGGGARDERPFAGSTADATSIISEVVDKKHHEISACLREFRTRKKMPAKDRVAVSFGIDQDGRLLGVTAKGKEDAELKSCVQEAFRNAPFPRSHSGVITVTKTYEELLL